MTYQSNLPEARWITQPEYKLAGQERRQAWLQIGLAEWRRHFRGFWRWGNMLLSNMLPLGLLSSLVRGMGVMPSDDFLLLAAITLATSASLVVGWGTEAMSRLALAAETTRTVTAGPTGASGLTRPFAPLFLFDISPTGRGGLLAGLVLDQGLILFCHAGPLLLLWTIAFWDFPFLVVSLLFWLLVAQAGLALAILLGRLAGAVCLWWAGIRSFCQRPSVWREAR